MSEASKASYRLHARRYGIARVARSLFTKGVPIAVALEILCPHGR